MDIGITMSDSLDCNQYHVNFDDDVDIDGAHVDGEKYIA